MTAEAEARAILSEHFPKFEISEMEPAYYWKSLEEYQPGDRIDHDGTTYEVLYSFAWWKPLGVQVYMCQVEPVAAPQLTKGTVMDERSGIEAYPVGLLWDVKRRRVWRGIRGYLAPQVRDRNWRAVRNYFNGYLAEWHYPPANVEHTRCGRGWTKRAAIRRLGIHIAESNLLAVREGAR